MNEDHAAIYKRELQYAMLYQNISLWYLASLLKQKKRDI